MASTLIFFGPIAVPAMNERSNEMMENQHSRQWAKKIAVAAISGGVGMVISNAAQAATATQAWHQGWVRCWGVNAVHKNDCLTATGSCAGTAPQAHDPNAYVLMPAGVCTEVGGTAIPGAAAVAHIKKIMALPSAKRAAIKVVPALREAEIYNRSAAEYFAGAAKWIKERAQ